MQPEPIYLKTIREGKFQEKIAQAYELMKSCALCARRCGVNRTAGETGYCKTMDKPVISSYGPHHGEEAPISGERGSGAIFLTGCNLGCVFCQNYEISHMGSGRECTVGAFAEVIVNVMEMGCHNVNFVTPSHQMPVIIEALAIAAGKGFNLPVVWNCGGYESPEALSVLEGIVDIYMPDFKFWDEKPSRYYLNAPDYPEIARAALKIMHAQTGDLIMDDLGIARSGLLVRHLVMPKNIAGTEKLVEWLAKEISPNTYVNIMDQYHPCFRARNFADLNRKITKEEYIEALKSARGAGLRIG